MLKSLILMLLSFMTATNAINRPVYKIVLTQKGFAQFLQYDVETPPLREFTFCTWIRIYDLGKDQTIFTYVVNGNHRMVRLWLDSGGNSMKIIINGRFRTSIPVDIIKDVWRHVCLSYQSDYGAWALYMDSRLISCEASQNLHGFILPGGGSIIVGYGTADNGSSNGFEGEIFGVNMILLSTIERNHTLKINPAYGQKKFKRNKLRGIDEKTNGYIILNNLKNDEVHNNFENPSSEFYNASINGNVTFENPYMFTGANSDIQFTTTKSQKPVDSLNEQEILDFSVTSKTLTTTDKNNMNFWNLVNQVPYNGKFKKQIKYNIEPYSSGTQSLPILSEYETPPPPGPTNLVYFKRNKDIPKSSLIDSIQETSKQSNKKKIMSEKYNELSDIETPPLPQNDNKVYGQWTSSQFAGSVLNYLKSVKFNSRKHKVIIPPTIPLQKISDSFPYASEFRPSKVKSPPQFQRRNIVENQFDIGKKSKHRPQINVQILEDDLRGNILKAHSQTHPKKVEVTNRGKAIKKMFHRFYRSAYIRTSAENSESTDDSYEPQVFTTAISRKKKQTGTSDSDILKNMDLLTVLPFLKSLEYFAGSSEKTGSENNINRDMYSRTLSSGNKWHNIKTYNNDYTPRDIKLDANGKQNSMEDKIEHINKKIPSVKLKYIHENHKIEKVQDPTILKGRILAKEVSNQSDYNRAAISIIKFNHGYLPDHEKKQKLNEKKTVFKSSLKNNLKNHFNKQIKLGNTLNERDLIGSNEEQKKKSFEGGDDKIPDINRYRSEIDDENKPVPSSLTPKVCKNVELYDRVLYVQPDQSIDPTHIMSPIKLTNAGIEFIQQNYKRCSLEESPFARNPFLYLDWSKTPVRLFGGAYAKTTTDLCGFF